MNKRFFSALPFPYKAQRLPVLFSGVVSPVVKQAGVKLTTDLSPANEGTYISSPHSLSWCRAWNWYSFERNCLFLKLTKTGSILNIIKNQKVSF